VNSIKLAGFGLGLAVTTLAMVGVSLVLPLSQPDAAAPAVQTTQTFVPVSEPDLPITTPRVPAPDMGQNLPQSMAMPDTAAPIVGSDSVQSSLPVQTAEITDSSVFETAPAAPVLTVPDMASLPASQSQSTDDSLFALVDTPVERPSPILQLPFAPPAMPTDALPVPPALPERASEPDPVDRIDTPAEDGGPAEPLPELSVPDPIPELDLPVETNRPVPSTLPGRPVTGMPGQVATRSTPEPDAVAPDVPLPALVRNAAAVDMVASAPLMALVLNDPGLSQDARLGLAARSIPFSVALNPMDPTAPEAATLYRAMGKEVFLMAAGLPDRASAADVDVTLSAYFATVPDAAGLIDLPREGAVRNARLLGDVLQVVARDGHGMITFAGGLGQATRAAAAAGVAHAEVFRVLDSGDQSPFTIRRFLDRAVFQASQLGQVIVYGEASNDAMLQALDLWQAEGRADQVALVPASTILLMSQGLAP
jgi:uncharacterized protein